MRSRLSGTSNDSRLRRELAKCRETIRQQEATIRWLQSNGNGAAAGAQPLYMWGRDGGSNSTSRSTQSTTPGATPGGKRRRVMENEGEEDALSYLSPTLPASEAYST